MLHEHQWIHLWMTKNLKLLSKNVGDGVLLNLLEKRVLIKTDLEKIGFDVHERVVRFPFWDDYKAHMKSKIADMKNIGGPNAGMISAGKFLEHFVKAPYIHMDIAGPAWLDSKENYKGDGGTGAGVRLLYQFLKNRYK